MSETPANPIFVALLFMLRCLVPVAVLLGISYLLRKLGLVAENPEPPSGYDDGDDLPPPEITNNEDEENEGDPTHDNS